jgi:hypothetical protein
MQRVAAARLCSVHHQARIEIWRSFLQGRDRSRSRDPAKSRRGTVAIRIRYADHGLDVQGLRGARDPQRDLTPVGDEDSLEGHQLSLDDREDTGCPRCTISPSLARIE